MGILHACAVHLQLHERLQLRRLLCQGGGLLRQAGGHRQAAVPRQAQQQAPDLGRNAAHHRQQPRLQRVRLHVQAACGPSPGNTRLQICRVPPPQEVVQDVCRHHVVITACYKIRLVISVCLLRSLALHAGHNPCAIMPSSCTHEPAVCAVRIASSMASHVSSCSNMSRISGTVLATQHAKPVCSTHILLQTCPEVLTSQGQGDEQSIQILSH